MKTPNVQKIAKTMLRMAAKHAPGILTGAGIAGMLAAVILVRNEASEADKVIEEASKDRDSDNPMNTVDKLKFTWKLYIPAAAMFTISSICLIGANSVNGRRNAALATACSLSETAFKEYKAKAVDILGERKEETIRDAVAQEKVTRNPPKSTEVIFTGKGNVLCQDDWSGRYFHSDADKLKRAVNDLNEQLLSEMYISLNDFYYAIGLPSVSSGDLLGWNLNNGQLRLEFSSVLTPEDREPCLVVGFFENPKYDFDKM